MKLEVGKEYILKPFYQIVEIKETTIRGITDEPVYKGDDNIWYDEEGKGLGLIDCNLEEKEQITLYI